MMITRGMVRAWGACYSDAQIAELVPLEGLTPLAVLDMNIPAADRLWVMLREDIIPAGRLRLLACDWAERVCKEVGHDDMRSLVAIEMARRYARGEATTEDLADARFAARGAVTLLAARVAAEAAALSAAETSAEAAVRVAARVARVAAAEVRRQRTTQITDVRRVLEECCDQG